MSDNKKKADDRIVSGNNESKREFLEKSGVGNWIRDALSKILSNRPDDAVGFLAQYFSTLGEKSNRLNRAYHYLTLSDHYQPAFANNVSTAYEILSSSSGSRTPAGLMGSAYRDVLNLICRNIPATFCEHLLNKIGPRDEEVIYPDIFHSGVVAAFVLIDYLKQTEELFQLLTTHQSKGVVDHELATTMLQELQDALSVKTTDPISILTAGSKLTNEVITDSLLEMLLASQNERRRTMTKDEFVHIAFNIYLKEVKPVK
ncbi:tubulin polyglutamylase complex subunit 1-like [Patiria miniata]|uniref:Tubulin polyglutamylase complex subunit 1-like C-terminal domain-containing protein n=1 Tax=Patiria miniata TaxID=46514 RepID=A0A913ZAM6_PATMI|nr:tubulin polyglutamylase complex subunit 1-like [Patiria miniata]